MLLPDANGLLYSHFVDSTLDHGEYAAWLTRMATGPEPFALTVMVLAGFVRIATNPRVFDPPSTIDKSFAFVSSLLEQRNARIVGPGPEHHAIFKRLCRDSAATGKLVADTQHSAVAIEHGCTIVSADADFRRLSELRWQHPLRRTLKDA